MTNITDTFVVKPTLFMFLFSEKNSDNIRKIYFAFKDGQFCSLELEAGTVLVKDHEVRERLALIEAEAASGLTAHFVRGGALGLPSKEVHLLFHTLWSKAVNAYDYDKAQWKELWRILIRCGYDV